MRGSVVGLSAVLGLLPAVALGFTATPGIVPLRQPLPFAVCRGARHCARPMRWSAEAAGGDKSEEEKKSESRLSGAVKVSFPTPDEGVAMGIREWPGFLKRDDNFEEDVRAGDVRYILEGTGSCTPRGEEAIELEPGTLIECTAPTSLEYVVSAPLTILTPKVYFSLSLSHSIANGQLSKLSTILPVLSLSRPNSSLVLLLPFSAGEDLFIRLSCGRASTAGTPRAPSRRTLSSFSLLLFSFAALVSSWRQQATRRLSRKERTGMMTTRNSARFPNKVHSQSCRLNKSSQHHTGMNNGLRNGLRAPGT